MSTARRARGRGVAVCRAVAPTVYAPGFSGTLTDGRAQPGALAAVAAAAWRP